MNHPFYFSSALRYLNLLRILIPSNSWNKTSCAKVKYPIYCPKMHINEESLRNITVRKNKHNFQLTTTEDHRRLSFNTETVSPTFPLEYYPRIGDTPTQNDQVSVINDYDELNTILQREAEERSVFSQTAQTENYTQVRIHLFQFSSCTNFFRVSSNYLWLLFWRATF